jgi:N utilization substance protein A
LFKQEVPEIYDGIIEIKSVARDPGSRAKVAVYTSDPSIDPIGACVGVRGSRVQSIIQELQGEKIDIVMWSPDYATLAVNALAPAEVSKVIVDEENRKFEVLTPDDQLSIAIGRRGQNVRLASMLIGWNVSVVSEREAMEKSNKEYHSRSKVFMDGLDCDEVISHLLVAEGFSKIEELVSISKEGLSSIEGFDENLSEELISRARNYVKKQEKAEAKMLKDANIDDSLINLGVFSNEMLLSLADNKILNLDNLGDLSVDELVEILPSVDKATASEVIMKAREHWFK